LKEFRLNTLR